MKHLEACLIAAAVVSLTSLALWTIADLWLPLVILAGVILAAVIVLTWKKKSG